MSIKSTTQSDTNSLRILSSQLVADSAPLKDFCESLKALSNPHRLRIMLSLQDGEASVGDLETGLQLKQPNLSHELRKLRDRGMVKTRRESKVVFYSIADQSTANLIQNISCLFKGSKESVSHHENKIAQSNASAFGENRSHGECGQFPLVQQT
ncbi:MAG: metalloregulator ArsR/SmtB family transcription factor [Arenicellales bacterium]